MSRLAPRTTSSPARAASFLVVIVTFALLPAGAAQAASATTSSAIQGDQSSTQNIIGTTTPVSRFKVRDTSQPSGYLQPLDTEGGDSNAIPTNIREAVAIGTVLNPNSGDNPGAFTYKFALALPPGRNGMTPDLDLTYSSTDHDDTGFGYGWSLSIPYIERYNKTG